MGSDRSVRISALVWAFSHPSHLFRGGLAAFAVFPVGNGPFCLFQDGAGAVLGHFVLIPPPLCGEFPPSIKPTPPLRHPQLFGQALPTALPHPTEPPSPKRAWRPPALRSGHEWIRESVETTSFFQIVFFAPRGQEPRLNCRVSFQSMGFIDPIIQEKGTGDSCWFFQPLPWVTPGSMGREERRRFHLFSDAPIKGAPVNAQTQKH